MKPLIWLALAMLTACVSRPPAPVVERAPAVKAPAAKAPTTPDARPDIYIVKKGDTLYSIGLAHGIAYKDIAVWNGIAPPYHIRIGQQLRLRPPAMVAAAPVPAAAPATTPAEEVITMPLQLEPSPVGRPLGESAQATAQESPAATPGVPLLIQPRAIRRPYSESARAAVAPAQPATSPAPAVGNEIDWGWPAIGNVISGYNDSIGANKGIKIAGTLGQPVFAAAAGRVVYSGAGLRGYGNLVIVKHNDTYLSAYAHNSKLLVKEGQTVTKGQKIAEMGRSDAPQVQLHFEIRKFGKPVDPANYLPANPG